MNKRQHARYKGNKLLLTDYGGHLTIEIYSYHSLRVWC